MGPLAVDVVETADFGRPLADQIKLVTVADADLIFRLATGREAVGRVDQRYHNGRFTQLEFLRKKTQKSRHGPLTRGRSNDMQIFYPNVLEAFDCVCVTCRAPSCPRGRVAPL